MGGPAGSFAARLDPRMELKGPLTRAQTYSPVQAGNPAFNSASR